MTLTKDVLVTDSAELGFTKKESFQMVEKLFETIKTSLERGEDVLISGFGKFCVRDKNERKGRNPATGKEKILDARRVVTFKCSSVQRDKINREK